MTRTIHGGLQQFIKFCWENFKGRDQFGYIVLYDVTAARMDLKCIGYKVTGWIFLIQNMIGWRPVMNAIVNFRRVLQNVRNYRTD